METVHVDVVLKSGVTKNDADTLWCDVIIPAGGQPSGGASLVIVWPVHRQSPFEAPGTCDPTLNPVG